MHFPTRVSSLRLRSVAQLIAIPCGSVLFGNCMADQMTPPPPSTSQALLNPPTRPHLKEGVGLYFFGDFLLWQAEEMNLPIGLMIQSTANLNRSKTKSIAFDWDVGFRVGLGYDMRHDGWNSHLTWLRFHTEGKRDMSAVFPEEIVPSRIYPNLNLSRIYNQATSQLHLHLDQIDLDCGKEFAISKWLVLRPYFGLRTNWIKQQWNIDYVQSASDLQVVVRQDNDWWGIGIMGGIFSKWGLWKQLSLIGDLSAAIEYGFQSVRNINRLSPPSSLLNFGLKNSTRMSRPILDLFLGLAWEAPLAGDRLYLAISSGWEHHVYFSQNQFPVFTNPQTQNLGLANQGDLSYQGWTLEASLGF